MMVPGSYGLPFIGQTFGFIDDNVKMMLGNYGKYGQCLPRGNS
jgi:hypothetical protein